MIQTLAIFRDSFRELNAKRMFWISLAISGLVVAVFAMVGVNPKGLTILVWELEVPGLNSTTIPPAVFYKTLYTGVGIKFWLGWIASILALISTASIFPDLIASGAIDLLLSKPIGRIRLFFTKYLAALLFVTLQVLLFSAASFVVIGIRGGDWEPGLFLAVPLTVLFFSYLFSMCVLLGLLTRSTVASLLLTMLLWFGIFGVNATDRTFVTFSQMNGMRVEALQAQEQRMEDATRKRLADARERGETGLPDPANLPEGVADELEAFSPFLATTRQRLRDAESSARSLKKWQSLTVSVKTVLPKTQETIELLERVLITRADLRGMQGESGDSAPIPGSDGVEIDQGELGLRVAAAMRARSVWWVVGTSVGFEAVVLAVAAWIFARRDF